MIERAPFGRTGHLSSRVVFGAAGVGAVDQEEADAVLPLLRRYGVNHLDCAASYGDAELRLAPWLAASPDEFFVATKTEHRDGAGARASLERSLTRLGVDSVDLVQLHNLVLPDEWETAHAPGGALAALVQAREEGLCRAIGVTGHGLDVARMHLRSLERFDHDSVLLPWGPALFADRAYRADVDRLLEVCAERSVAVQAIKVVARRRWQDEPAPGERRLSWYEPLTDAGGTTRAVRAALAEPALFLPSPSALEQLELFLQAALPHDDAVPDDDALAEDVRVLGIEPLFRRSASV